MKFHTIILYVILGVFMLCFNAEYAHAVEVGSIRMAHLKIKQDQLVAFTESVKEEMEAALRVEPGVAAIYAVANKQDPADLLFFEMYADENTYNLHRETPHFQKYFQTTKDMLADRVLMQGVPVELRDRHNTPATYPNINKDAKATAIRIAYLQIKKEHLDAFLVAVKEGMESSLRTEPGVIAIYAVADKNDPTKMTFFEMYVDEKAYQSHRATPHFQKYFNTTKDMLADRVLIEAVPVELRDKHNTPSK